MNPSENPLSSLDEETQMKIQEIQMQEQGFQQLILQKRSFKYELDETDYAIKELEKAEGEVFKIVGGQIVIKTDKNLLKEELTHKKELIEIRLKNIETQESEYSKNIEAMREEVMKKLAPKKSK
jgi:prefoldin beta subunit